MSTTIQHEKKVDANYEEEAKAATPLDPNIQLNERQELAREMIKDLVARPEGENKTGIVLGIGGTGKTTVVQAVQHDVETGLDYGVGSVGKFATSGVAARLLQGSTAHSSKRGFALPVKQLFKELKGKTLKQLQKRHKDLVLVILDEYSMLKQRELHYINKRLQEIKGNQLPFGGVAFILIGDPGQLPPVQGNVLWCPIASKDDDKAGHLVYQSFHENVMELVEVNRIKGDPDAAKYLEIMMAVRHGNGTKEQWQTVVSNCCQDGMPPHEWNERFGGDDVTYLFTTNQEVLNFNLDKLKKLGAPIALIEAEHTGKGKSMSADALMGLQASLYLAVGAKVLLSVNLSQGADLVNGSVGTVMDIVYEEEEEGSNPSPTRLPKYVWVDFGKGYTGPSFFPNNKERRGWFPVEPHRASEYSGGKESTRTMIPLRLSWAWTIWKAQGQTIKGKLVVSLSDKEKECGLTYVAFSRATKLRDIGIIGGLTYERFTAKIRNHSKMRFRNQEMDKLRKAVDKTIKRLQEANN